MSLFRRIKKLYLGVFPGRIPEADLQRESALAATAYTSRLGNSDFAVKQQVTNYYAHGFYCGVRWMEEKTRAGR